MNIDNIINAIRDSRVRITDHADEEAFDDSLTYEEIYSSVIQGDIIEDYPNDRPYPSCLILGRKFSGEPIHSVLASHSRLKKIGQIKPSSPPLNPPLPLWVKPVADGNDIIVFDKDGHNEISLEGCAFCKNFSL